MARTKNAHGRKSKTGNKIVTIKFRVTEKVNDLLQQMEAVSGKSKSEIIHDALESIALRGYPYATQIPTEFINRIF